MAGFLAKMRTALGFGGMEAKALAYPPGSFWLEGNPYRNDLHDDHLVGRSGAMGASALVYACMAFRARKLAEAPVWLADENDGNETWLAGTAAHPLARLLEQPNPDQPTAAFLAWLSCAMDMGPTLVVKSRDRLGRVASLYVWTWDQFTVEAATVDGTRRMYGRFVVTDGAGNRIPYGPEDVLYFPALAGVSPVDAALSHVRVSESMRRAIKSTLAKSMRPGSFMRVGGTMDETMFHRYKGQLDTLFSGENNTGRNLLVSGDDVEFTPLSTSMKDLDLGPVQGDVEAAICQAFQIHPALVGAKIALENSSGLSDSLKPALSLFYDLVAFPRWQEIETALTAGLLREVDPAPNRFVRFVTDNVRALAPDLVADVNVAKAATGIMTLNEQRAALHLPPIADATGDVIAPAAGTGQAANDPAQAGAAPSAPQKSQVVIGNATAGELTAAQQRALLDMLAPETKAAPLATEDQRAAYWQAFEAKAAKRLPAYEAAARRLFRDERAAVGAILRNALPKNAPGPTERKDDAGGTMERDAIREAWEAPYLDAAVLAILAEYDIAGPVAEAWFLEFRALLTVTINGAVEEFVARAGVTFSMDNPAVIRAIEERAAALVRNVLDTTRRTITDTIAAGRAEGLTIAQIAERVNERAFGAMAEARAQAIANTEVVGAINDAEWLAANAPELGGLFKSKRWIHTRRPGDRDYHDAHEYEGPNGGWVPMDYQYRAQNGFLFPRPFAPGLAASEVVRCGCTMAFSDVEPAQAQEEG